MSRPVSPAARQAMYARQTEAVFLDLVEITHPALAEPLRFVYNTQAIAHQGHVYQPAAFRYEAPPDVEGSARPARLSICNVTREVMLAVRSLSTPPTLIVKQVLASQPDTVERGPLQFVLRNINSDAFTISADLVDADNGQVSIPGIRKTSSIFPGLHV